MRSQTRTALQAAVECDDSLVLSGGETPFAPPVREVAADAADAGSAYSCAVEEAARIVGQKWTLQIVNVLMDFHECRFCELQDALGGVNPSTLSTRLKMLEEQGILERIQISAMPPHVVYRLTTMGEHLSGVIRELTHWSRTWLCAADAVSRPASAAERSA